MAKQSIPTIESLISSTQEALESAGYDVERGERMWYSENRRGPGLSVRYPSSETYSAAMNQTQDSAARDEAAATAVKELNDAANIIADKLNYTIASMTALHTIVKGPKDVRLVFSHGGLELGHMSIVFYNKPSVSAGTRK